MIEVLERWYRENAFSRVLLTRAIILARQHHITADVVFNATASLKVPNAGRKTIGIWLDAAVIAIRSGAVS